MKKLSILIAVLGGIVVFAPAEGPVRLRLNWGLLWSGSWEENRNLHNRTELRFNILPAGLMLRAQIIDRRTMNFDLESRQWSAPWENTENAVTHFTGGLYHRPTGSRLLLGVLDEWGLSARIRNPWIRSPPYVENHRPMTADLRIAASSTREEQIYLYLSTPNIKPFNKVRLKSFAAVQSALIDDVRSLKPVFSGGVDFVFADRTRLLLEGFYTGRTLPQRNAGSWFSDPPALPERESYLYAAGVLFSTPAFSMSSDFAVSETFAWGKDIYCSLGITLTPLIPVGRRLRPLTISFAADGAGERFVNRDGANLNEGFRSAVRIQWRGNNNSLLRVNSVLRAGGFGGPFNRSSTGFYYRFPARSRHDLRGGGFLIRLTTISLSADRNAANILKINDNYSGSVAFSLSLLQFGLNSPLRITFSCSIAGSTENSPFLYPIPGGTAQWDWENTSLECDFFWPLRNFQFRASVGRTFFPEKDDIWGFSFSTAIRFRQGRLSFRLASSDFPEKWSWTVSWRLEKTQKR